MASLTQIARKASVSVTAASLVLNKKDHGTRVGAECAQRIREIAKELGYVPNYHASSIKRGCSETVAVAMDLGWVDKMGSIHTHPELEMPYFGLLVGGIEAVMRGKGYLVTLVGPDARGRAPERALVGVRQQRFDGMIVLGTLVKTDAPNLLQQAPKQPIVVIQPQVATELATIDYDEVKAMELAVEYLVSLGHRRLLWVGESQGKTAVNRQATLVACCQRHGVAVEVLNFRVPTGAQGFVSYHDVPDAARDAVLERLQARRRDFTAVICYNDNMGVGVVDALLSAGLRVPEDVSVIGHDDFEGRRSRPKLTSVDHRLGEMGKRAAEVLLEMMQSPAAVETLRGKRELVEPVLAVRGSTGPVSGDAE
jgi:LacI family transcriptional regulator